MRSSFAVPRKTPLPFCIDGHEFVVVGRSTRAHVPDSLSDAEAEVYLLLVSQKDKEAIAAKRGTAVGTVRNQIQSIYCKLGVTGQAELLACVHWLPDVDEAEGRDQ